MAIHMRIKLNTKRLYAADTRAVQEMLKLAVRSQSTFTFHLRTPTSTACGMPLAQLHSRGGCVGYKRGRRRGRRGRGGNKRGDRQVEALVIY